MNLVVGKTYRSPKHGRYITILEIDDYDGDKYDLDVEYVDKDTGEREDGPITGITVSSLDTFEWVEVNV